MKSIKILAVVAFATLVCGCSHRASSGSVKVPRYSDAVAYPAHVEFTWESENGAEYELYRKEAGIYVLVGKTSSSPYLDFSIGGSSHDRQMKYLLCPVGMKPSKIADKPEYANLMFDVTVPAASDSLLVDLVEKYASRYFTDYAEPATGLARERSNNTNGDIVTIGGSGFGIMSVIAAEERGYVSDSTATSIFDRVLSFLESAEKFHGAWSHWYDADSRKTFSFSKYDDGGDIVETAFMAQGLITLRQYLKDSKPELASRADKLWKGIDWNWYTRGTDSLYWHWSKNWGWKMNHRITGFDETLITYILGAASPTHPIKPEVYGACYKNSTYYYNGKQYYGITLPIGMELGGPLFFTHYSFLGLDPRGLEEGVNYFDRNRAHALIHYNYAMDNPKGHRGLGPDLWGFTSSDDPLVGYCSHHPGTQDENGTVSPTAPVSSIVYTPEESLQCMRHMYYDLGSKLFGPMGFYDAYNPSMAEGEQVVRSYLAIDEGPMVVMLENWRSGLLWNLFMSAPEVKQGLSRLGFKYDTTNQ